MTVWRGIYRGLLVLTIVSTSLSALADNETDRLAPMQPFVGRCWLAEGEFPGAGPYTVRRSYQWMLDEAFVEFRQTMKVGGREFSVTAVIGWHPERNKIVAWSFSNDGGVTITEMKSSAPQIVFEGLRHAGGESRKIRGTFAFGNEGEFTEVAEEWKSSEWTRLFEFHFIRSDCE